MAKKAKKRKAKKKITTPKVALSAEPEIEISAPIEELVFSEPAPKPVESPKPEPAKCTKCGNTFERSEMVACPKCSALMCKTCAGHSPCPRCGV